MKKKTIEKIPYLKLPRVNRNETVKYIAVTAVKKICQEKHLFVEVYRNKKECREVPVVRIAIAERDYGVYFPESGEWDRRRISRTAWYSYGLIWLEDHERVGKSTNILAEENILYSEADLKRIQKFSEGITIWNEKEWWEYIDQKQRDIDREERYRRETRRRERRKQALEERQENTPELPKERILAYAEKFLFQEKHYLYYKKHGARAEIACSNCGEITEGRWKTGLSFESQFERTIQEPVMGAYGTCPRCGAFGKYVPQGKAKSVCGKKHYLFLGQRYKDTGMVFRYVEVEKEWQVELMAGEKGVELNGAHERLTGIELARVYFEQEKKIQKDYHKHNPYLEEDFWDDCNLSGISSIGIGKAEIMPETYENMEGTFLQYSALKEYQKAERTVNPVDYLERYIQTPQIEMIVKMGLVKVAEMLVGCHYGIVADVDADRIDRFLGIRSERIKQLVKCQGEYEILNIMQMEKRKEMNWTDKQIEQLAELRLDSRRAEFLEYMGVQRLLNQVSKYAGCEYGTMCGRAENRLRQTAITYLDYLHMRKELGYDMRNTVYLFPRNLEKAHMEMAMQQNKTEADRRIRETEAKYPLIRKHYRQLRKRFYFQDEEFVIRPARSAEEIVQEGRILHHCVGGDRYLEGHNKGCSIILFLRNKKKPKVPYITVEINAETLSIAQWYGAMDKKPDKERMQKWIDNYVTRLKYGGLAAGQEVENETVQRIRAYA